MSEKPLIAEKKRFPVSVLSVIACYLPVHGYRFFHLLASGDALLLVYQNDAAWEIALGRFAHVFAVLFRGGLTAPYLLSLLTMCWMALAVWLIVYYLDLKRVSSVFLTAAFLVINRTMIMLSAGYLPWVDVYAFAMLAAVLGVVLASRQRAFYTVLAAVSFMVSLGLYQAYICMALGLVVVRTIVLLAGNADKKETLKHLVWQGVAFALSAVLYLAIWKGLQGALNIWTADGYNGMAGIGESVANNPLALLAVVYGNVASYFVTPVRLTVMTFRGMDLNTVWEAVFRIANCLLFLAGLVYARRMNLRNKTSAGYRMLQVVLLALLPLCVNLVCFLTGGVEHILMVHAFQMFYVLVVVLRDAEPVEAGAGPATVARRLVPVILPVLAFLILWPQVICANQVYLRKSLQEEAAQSLMTRVLQTIEQTDGYVPGMTPVAFTGSPERNPYIEEKDVMTDEMPWGQMKTVFTYGGIERHWLAFFEHMTVRPAEEAPAEEVTDGMPCFPVKGSVAWSDGVLVVKLSE